MGIFQYSPMFYRPDDISEELKLLFFLKWTANGENDSLSCKLSLQHTSFMMNVDDRLKLAVTHFMPTQYFCSTVHDKVS